MLLGQDDRHHRNFVRHRRADRRTRRRRSAPTSSASTSTSPQRPLDAFIKADIGSAQGVAEIVETLPQRFDALVQCRRRLRHDRRGEDARDQFLRPAGTDAKPSRRGCARAAPSSMSPRSPAMAGAPISSGPRRSSAAPGFPDLGPLLAAHKVPDGEAYPLSKELLLLWTMRAAHRPSVQGARRAGQRRQPRPGDDADPQGISLRSSATRGSTTTSRASAAPARRRTSRRRRSSSARTARAGSTAPTCRSTAASKPRSTRVFSDSEPRRAFEPGDETQGRFS